MHGTTFGGGPLACAVALEFLKTLEQDHVLKHVVEVGKYFRDRLQELDARYPEIQDVRGIGLMLGMELDSADLAKTVPRRCWRTRSSSIGRTRPRCAFCRRLSLSGSTWTKL